MRKPLPGSERKFRNMHLGRSKHASKAFSSSPKLIKEISGLIKRWSPGWMNLGTLYHCHYFIPPCGAL